MRKLALLAPATLALAACGGGGNHATTTVAAGADPIASAAAATQAAGSEHMTLAAKVTLGSGGSGQTFVITGDGAFDQKASTGDLTGTLGLGKNVPTTPIEEVFEGQTVYLRSPLIAGLAGGGKPWVSIDLAKAGSVGGFDIKALTGESPSDVLAQLGGASGTKTVGHAQVGGVDTTHYAATVGGNPVDVWVDGNNLIRKVHLDYTTQATKSSSAHIVLDMGLSNFGVEVKATPPAASQVSTLSA